MGLPDILSFMMEGKGKKQPHVGGGDGKRPSNRGISAHRGHQMNLTLSKINKHCEFLLVCFILPLARNIFKMPVISRSNRPENQVM